MTDELATRQNDAAMLESVLLGGDLSKLTPAQRVNYYKQTCDSLGLNPLTKPFGYITLNGRLVLYALKDAAEQLRNNRHVSITQLEKTFRDDLYIVTAYAQIDGRTDASTGVVSLAGLTGEKLANALMKAETKAKRRVTLSICGLGFLDESEISSIPDAQPITVTESGEIAKPMQYDQAAAVLVHRHKDDEGVRMDTLSSPELQRIVEKSDKPELVDAALTVLEHDFNMPRPGSA